MEWETNKEKKNQLAACKGGGGTKQAKYMNITAISNKTSKRIESN